MTRSPSGVRKRLLPLVLAAGCAQIEPAPGGPEDRTPPVVVSTRPADEAVAPGYGGPVVFQFSERISERGVENAVMVSPRTSPVLVRHGRDEIRVSLRGGWEANRIYHVTLAPGIRDLFGNATRDATTLVFSTGPAIPATGAVGVVVDRIERVPVRGVRVEAIRMVDSLVYAVPTDSAGSFRFRPIPPGDYQIRAFADMNSDRSLQPFEPRDSAYATIAEGALVELSLQLLAPDSTPPVAGTASLRERRVEVEFDDYLDPDQDLGPASVTIVGPAGVPLPVEAVGSGGPAGARAGAAPGDATPARRATRQLVIDLAAEAEIEPGAEYTVRVVGVRNVNGLTADATTTFTAPRPPPAAPADLR